MEIIRYEPCRNFLASQQRAPKFPHRTMVPGLLPLTLASAAASLQTKITSHLAVTTLLLVLVMLLLPGLVYTITTNVVSTLLPPSASFNFHAYEKRGTKISATVNMY
ncbi:hypothetical protein E2C01_062726 [Portunus trituberculatus]|uniref:Uncharacterized protein n=1 Tax=Portunus trituberculatus TaxID=210409 RepID=A0A5B7HIU8_PORTR|nr:hypothetical protein [Portunus trituberculatus]